MRRPILSAAAPACILLGLTPLSASADVAPPGSASAAAARVANVAGISTTGASADQTKADARAAVISIGGDPALGTGGSQSSEGESGGALVDTGSDKAPRVRVAPWKTKATGTKGSDHRSSSASAALARVDVPQTAKVGVLTSDAAAEHTNGKSSGSSTSDAADVSIGETLHLVLLHSEVDTAAKGTSYLVGLNGTKIGTREQLGSLCALDAGVASLSCLTASGGTANGITSGSAEVLGVKAALGLDPVNAFTTAASTGAGSEPAILESAASAVPAAEAPRAAAAAPVAGELPRTGVAAAALAASAVAGLLMGLVLRLLGRRRVAA